MQLLKLTWYNFTTQMKFNLLKFLEFNSKAMWQSKEGKFLKMMIQIKFHTNLAFFKQAVTLNNDQNTVEC